MCLKTPGLGRTDGCWDEVGAAEMSAVSTRLLVTKAQKATVIPLILEGPRDESR